MQTALRIETTVLEEGKIQISNPQLQTGAKVEVIILLPALLPMVHETTKQLSVMDILNEAEGHRLFKTADEVNEYLREERGVEMAMALEQLTEINAVAGITDPIAWEREIREDRILLGRDTHITVNKNL